MNTGKPIGEALRVCVRLPEGSYLVSAAGSRRRRPQWVLRWSPDSASTEQSGRIDQWLLRLSALDHPSLALPVDVGIDPASGHRYWLRRYVEGAPLPGAVEGRSPMELLPWLIAIAEALEILHRFGIAHGRVTASNVIVPRGAAFRRRGSHPLAVITDVACPEDSGADPSFAFASDLRQLGALYYRLLARRELNPKSAEFPVAPTEYNPEIPLDLERVVLKLLHPSEEKRYQRASDLVRDLRRLGGDDQRSASRPPDCFAGRDAELRRCTELLDDPRRPFVLAVSGEAGIGKSAFLRRLLLTARVRGYLAVAVRCYHESKVPLTPLRALAARLAAAQNRRSTLVARIDRLLAQPDFGPEPGARRAFLHGIVEYFTSLKTTRPALLIVDEAHLADPLTVECLAELAKEIEATRHSGVARDHAALSLVFSYRSESSFRPSLAGLLDRAVTSADSHSLLELAPLSPETVEQWVERATGGPSGIHPAARLPARFRGNPFAVRAAIHGGSPASGERDDDLSSLHAAFFARLDAEERRFIHRLAVLGRPASLDLLAAITGGATTVTRRVVSKLLALETITREDDLVFFRHGSMYEWVRSSVQPMDAARTHGEIASALEGRPAASAEEIAHHWLRSSTPLKGVEVGLDAAGSLARNHEDRAALEVYRRVLDLLPPERAELRRRVTRETAELWAKTGDYGRAIDVLKSLVRESGAPAVLGHLEGRIGFYHHLAGDVTEAIAHLEVGLSHLSGSTEAGCLRDRLVIEAELATIALNLGDYERAEGVCRRALDLVRELASSGDDSAVIRAAMGLVATLGGVNLRRFRYLEARDDFERSLSLGEKLGPVPERSLILNNLGVVHLQQNRYQEAIRSFHRAADEARVLGLDLMLLSIECNLAVLYAKTGETSSADEAMQRASFHEARCRSNRARFLRLHTAGVVALSLGRHASAIQMFKEALIVGEELQDRHMLAFDLTYLGECHLYRGETKAAAMAFDRALAVAGGETPTPVSDMVEARRVLLAALRGEHYPRRGPAQATDAKEARHVEYLESWNVLYIGWADRLLGRWDDAREALRRARAFFARTGVPAGEWQAELELASLEADRGEHERAARRLERVEAQFARSSSGLEHPVLSARLRSYQVRVALEGDAPDLDRATSLLIEAESHLIGRRVQDLENLIGGLRRRLQLLRLQHGGLERRLPPPSRALSDVLLVLQDIERDTEQLIRRLEDGGGDLPFAAREEVTRELCAYLEHLREALRGHEEARAPDADRAEEQPGVRAILGRSQSVRELRDLVRRIAGSGLPVLIRGETGTGKDLVARALHEESPRRSAVFLQVNCAAVPDELLETELFGHRRGAFTGAEEDRDGLLLGASGGTFLFDGIDGMSLAMQGKLLKVLDRGCVRPIGASEERPLDVRYAFSTHRRLPELVAEGRMRQDLYYRIHAIEIEVPPLRERIEDLEYLIEHFQALATDGGERLRLTPEARAAFRTYPWPGNVRELRNVITRLSLSGLREIDAESVQKAIGEQTSWGLFSSALLRSRSLDELQTQLEREYLLQMHADQAGDLKRMAARLGITLRGLYKRLERLGIDPREIR